MKRFALLTLAALAACATVPPPAPSPVAALGETARVGDLEIRPLALLEDSRCPASVQCVWAGQVRIRAMITPRGLVVPTGPDAPSTAAAREIDMTLGTPVVEFGRTVVLSDVVPAKTVPGATDPATYRFVFSFMR